MTGKAIFRGGLIAVSVLLLGACEGIKQDFGFGKSSPDEFRVVSRAPLSLPPDFSLRPPRPGIARPQEGTATQQARSAVFRATDGQPRSLDEVIPEDGRSRGERALLMAAGADNVEPNIRQLLNSETNEINENDQDFIDNLVFWREQEIPGVVVDAEAEAKRIRENAALGRSVSTGQTPTIERKKKALLEGLF